MFLTVFSPVHNEVILTVHRAAHWSLDTRQRVLLHTGEKKKKNTIVNENKYSSLFTPEHLN